MEMIKNILDINNDVYGIIKVTVAVSGFFALLRNTTEAFSDKQRKQNLKTDLEIFEISKNLNSKKMSQIRNRVESEIDYLYNTDKYSSDNLLNFILGFILLVGFSFWTINLVQNSADFNPWIILTMFMAGVGFTMLFDKRKKEMKGEFFRIEFYDKKNIQIGFIILVIAAVCMIILIVIYEELTLGLFAAALFVLTGFIGVVRNIKFKRIKKSPKQNKV